MINNDRLEFGGLNEHRAKQTDRAGLLTWLGDRDRTNPGFPDSLLDSNRRACGEGLSNFEMALAAHRLRDSDPAVTTVNAKKENTERGSYTAHAVAIIAGNERSVSLIGR